MLVTEAYRDMQTLLKDRHVPSELVYARNAGFRLRFNLPDGHDYTLTHPEETGHGGWDLATGDGRPVLTGVQWGKVMDYVTITQLAAAVWAATPTPPAGLQLAAAGR